MSERPQKQEHQYSPEELQERKEMEQEIAEAMQSEREETDPRKKVGHFHDTETPTFQDLDYDDFRMWRAVRNGDITQERSIAYNTRNKPRQTTPFRESFKSWINNKATLFLYRAGRS